MRRMAMAADDGRDAHSWEGAREDGVVGVTYEERGKKESREEQREKQKQREKRERVR